MYEYRDSASLFCSNMVMLIFIICYSATASIDSLRICQMVNKAKLCSPTAALFPDRENEFIVEGYDNTTFQWSSITAHWLVYELEISDETPRSSSRFSFNVLTPGSGFIVASYETLSCTLYVNLHIDILPPRCVLSICDSNEYDISSTLDQVKLVYGDTLCLKANFIDYNGVVLTRYETPPASDSIHWNIISENDLFQDPSARLEMIEGNRAMVISTNNNYSSILLTISLESSPQSLCTLKILFYPVSPSYVLVIEAEDSIFGTRLYTPAPVISTRILPQTSLSLYAITRDIYGNFINYATLIKFQSLDTSVVKVSAGNPLRGEFILEYNGLGTTTVQCTFESDTVWENSASTVVTTQPISVKKITKQSISIQPSGGVTYFDLIGRKIPVLLQKPRTNYVLIKRKTERKETDCFVHVK